MLKLYFTIVFILFGLLSFGKSKDAEGYIITNNQDTIYGSFRLKTDRDKKLIYAKTQEKISFFNEEGKRTVYHPGDIKSFYFFYNLETLTFKSVPFFKNGDLFLKVVSEKGNLRLYQLFPDGDKRLTSVYELAEVAFSTGLSGEKFFFCIFKPNGEVLVMGRHTPKNKIRSFFTDYPELFDKIDSREYKYTDVYRMVREYNAWKKGMEEEGVSLDSE